MKSINKIVTGTILSLLATVSIANTTTPQKQLSTLEQLKQATSSPENQYFSSTGYGSEVILITILEQLKRLEMGQEQSNHLLLAHLTETKKTNAMLEYMSSGGHLHDKG